MVSLAPLSAGVPRVRVVALDAAAPGRAAASSAALPVDRSPGRPRSPSASGPSSLGREVIRIGARATRAAGRTEPGRDSVAAEGRVDGPLKSAPTRPAITLYGASTSTDAKSDPGATYKQSRPFNPAGGTDGSNQNGV